MYNGIGLQTPRGSGTSGHVQASRFLAKPRPSSSAAAGGGGTPDPLRTGSGLEGTRKPNKDILEHDRKRQVELRLLVLRDALEEQGYTEAEIVERVEEERKAAEAEAAAEEGQHCAQGKGFMNTHGHHAAARKENQLQTMRGALGLDAESDVEPGELVPRKQGTMMRLAARPVGRVKHECNLDADYDLDLRKSEK